mmetsp:Transcript_19767/g.47158  ORF Transcript_19767/g.47158 Transcript_19767/m.47158 type:complete len:206 (+) Transcript_19767:797-1414(+)
MPAAMLHIRDIMGCHCCDLLMEFELVVRFRIPVHSRVAGMKGSVEEVGHRQVGNAVHLESFPAGSSKRADGLEDFKRRQRCVPSIDHRVGKISVGVVVVVRDCQVVCQVLALGAGSCHGLCCNGKGFEVVRSSCLQRLVGRERAAAEFEDNRIDVEGRAIEVVGDRDVMLAVDLEILSVSRPGRRNLGHILDDVVVRRPVKHPRH